MRQNYCNSCSGAQLGIETFFIGQIKTENHLPLFDWQICWFPYHSVRNWKFSGTSKPTDHVECTKSTDFMKVCWKNLTPSIVEYFPILWQIWSIICQLNQQKNWGLEIMFKHVYKTRLHGVFSAARDYVSFEGISDRLFILLDQDGFMPWYFPKCLTRWLGTNLENWGYVEKPQAFLICCQWTDTEKLENNKFLVDCPEIHI